MTAHRRPGLALALLATTQFVLILDASIVGVALPSIGRALSFAPEDLSWVANGYLLAFGGLLLLGGRVADLMGRRRMFMAGLALFGIASLLGGLSVSAPMLVAARAVQGAGAAMVAPAALALVMTIFAAGPARNRALGVFGAVAGTGGAAGSILGGVLTDWLGWQATLYVNVPIAALAVALAPRLLPEAGDAARRGFDVAGAATATGGLALLVYAIVDANDAGWVSAQTLGTAAAALALLAAFVVIEARSANPLVPLRIFRSPTLRGANLVAVLLTLSMFPMFFYLTFYLQQVLGYGTVRAGFGALPVAVTIAVAAGLAAALITRVGFRIPTVAGLLLLAAGLAWFSRMSADGSFLADVAGPSIVMGVGGALTFVSTTVAATTGVRPEESGLASGLINTAQQVGGALGLAIVVTLVISRTSDALAAGDPAPVALTSGYRLGMLTAAAIALAAAVLSAALLRGRVAQPEKAEPELVGA